MNPTPTILPKPVSAQPCPCGSGRTYAECCEPVITGRQPAADAERLMRARFTAHVAQDFAFLHRSFLPTSKLPYTPEPAEEPFGWTRLVVHSHEPGARPDLAYVDFTAYHAGDGVEAALHEKSEFRRVDGEWLYARTIRFGPAPIKSAAPKVGRNDPCPCGSGKKYKQCCGR